MVPPRSLASSLGRLSRIRLAAPSAPRRVPRPRLRAYSSPASFLSTTLSSSPTFFSSVHPSDAHGEPYLQIPAFRTLDGDGSVLAELDPVWLDRLRAVPHATLTKMLEIMTLLPALDTVLSSSQRQGRISFYMTSYGEEGGELGDGRGEGGTACVADAGWSVAGGRVRSCCRERGGLGTNRRGVWAVQGGRSTSPPRISASPAPMIDSFPSRADLGPGRVCQAVIADGPGVQLGLRHRNQR